MGIFSFLFGNSKSKAASQAHIKWREGPFPMQVVGESNYQDALVAICGAHTRHGHDGEYEALVECEPTNRHDPNAIMVKIGGRKVGYLPREQAQRVGQQMREVGLTRAVCSARVRGGWRTNQYDEGHYGVSLAIPNLGRIDFGVEQLR